MLRSGPSSLTQSLSGNQQACAVHLQPRLSEFLNLAAKQLVSISLLEELLVVLSGVMPWFSSLLLAAFSWQGHDVKENVSVANNACWAIGEVAIKVRKEISPIVLNVISSLVPILSNTEVSPTICLRVVQECGWFYLEDIELLFRVGAISAILQITVLKWQFAGP